MNPIITHIGTACCLIEIDGFKILTDPVLDDAGKYYHHGFGAISKKTTNPHIELANLKDVDLILLSHPQHKDNFDVKGRAFAKTVPLVLSTKRIEKELKNGKGLLPWEEYVLDLPGQKQLKITATPAQHHPNWLPTFISGKVIGFIIELSTSPDALYITGDTIYFPEIEAIASKFKTIKYALIHVGSAEVRYLSGWGQYTMAAAGFVKTVKAIEPQIAIPIHNDGWSHFRENDAGILKALRLEKHDFQAKITFLEKGVPTPLNGLLKA
ncbi:MAG TPA: hypothetical protein ENK52_06355 [Saprospiraceae bacterium]|nr:hypothetical protein [Saprospiraceae bacterium]